MKCLNCNQDNLESSNYCRKCGYFFKKEQTININEEIYNNKDLSEIFDNPIIYIIVFIISIIGMILSNKDIIPSSLSFVFMVIGLLFIMIGRKKCPYSKIINIIYFLTLKFIILMICTIVSIIKHLLTSKF